jgi:hypothetical protein
LWSRGCEKRRELVGMLVMLLTHEKDFDLGNVGLNANPAGNIFLEINLNMYTICHKYVFILLLLFYYLLQVSGL